VARGENDAAEGAALADEVRRRRRRQDPATADDHAPEAVRGRHAEDGLDRFAIVISAVATDDERASSRRGHGIDDRLNEVLEVVRLLEDQDFLAEPRRSGTLIGERSRRDLSDGEVLHGHGRSLVSWRCASLQVPDPSAAASDTTLFGREPDRLIGHVPGVRHGICLQMFLPRLA
jgi:hypothetical protein